MPGKAKSSIRMAVRACLAQCRNSKYPMSCLQEYVAKLADIGWDPDAIRAVEWAVLVGLYGGDPESATG